MSADGVIAEAPTTVVEACWIAEACSSLKRTCAAAASCRWCAACSATSSRDLALERGVQALLLRDLRSRCRVSPLHAPGPLAPAAWCASLEHLAAVLRRGAEVLHLREDIGVGLRHRLRVVDARDHVVEVLRAEHDLERRLLIRRVQRDEPLRDRALPDLQVVLRDASSRRFSRRSRWICASCAVAASYCDLARSSESESCRELCHDLLRLRPLRRNRGVGERRDCGQKGHADPGEKVRRLSQPTNDDPRTGDGTGAPVGAGASRGGSVPRSTDNRQFTNCANMSVFYGWTRLPPPQLWYGPRPRAWAGTHAAAAVLAVCRPGIRGLGRHRRSAVRTRPITSRSLRTHDAQIADAVTLGGAGSLCARSSPRGREHAASESPRACAVAGVGAARAAAADSHRTSQHAVIAQRSLAQRLRALYEEGDVEPIEILLGSKNLERRDDEPRQPVSHVAGRPGRSRVAQVRESAARDRSEQSRAAGDRARRRDAFRAGISRCARANTRAAERVHQLARSTASDDAAARSPRPSRTPVRLRPAA